MFGWHVNCTWIMSNDVIDISSSAGNYLQGDGVDKSQFSIDYMVNNKRRRPSRPNGEMFTLEFENCSSNFGISLDNKTSERTKVSLGSVYISKISPNSPASLDNRLQVGDKVFEVNGKDISKASLERSRYFLLYSILVVS